VLVSLEGLARLQGGNPRIEPGGSLWNIFEHTNLYGQYDKADSFRVKKRQVSCAKTPGQPRIICLGSSSTFGAGLSDFSLAFPEQLQRRIPEAEILNAGVGGYNSYQLGIYLSDVLVRLKPDVVLFYYGGNEIYSGSAKLYYPRAKQIVAAMRARGRDSLPELHNALQHGTANPYALAAYHLLDHSRLFQWLRGSTMSLRDVRLKDGDYGTIEPREEQILADICLLAQQNNIRLLLIPELSPVTKDGICNHEYWNLMQQFCADGRAECFNPLEGQTGLDRASLFVHETHFSLAGCEWLAARLEPVVRRALANAPTSQATQP